MTALFCYGGLHPLTYINLERDMFDALTHPEDTSYSLTRAAWWNDALIDRCRGMAAEQFLKFGCDVMVMIDHDLAWKPGDVVYIAKKAWEKQAIVGAAVAKRQKGSGIASVVASSGSYRIGSDDLVEAPYVGSAFTAVPRQIVEAVARDLPATVQGFRPMFTPMVAPCRDPSNEGGFDYLSEDWAFCRRATDKGYRCFISMKPIIEHHGDYAYTIEDVLPTKVDKSPPTFSLIHATRGRPAQAVEAHATWMRLASGNHPIEYIVSVDDDDPDPIPDNPPDGVTIVTGHNRGNVDAYNRGAYRSTGDILIQVHDDVTPPQHWDELIVQALGGNWDREAVLAVGDGLPRNVNGDRKILPILIGTSKWFRSCGYFYAPCYVSVFCDNDAAELAEKHGVIVDAGSIVFQHRYEGPDRDETQRRSYSQENWAHGERCLQERRSDGFPRDPSAWGDASRLPVV